EAGVDALGFVFADSPRRVTPPAATHIVSGLPPLVSAVGVFVDDRAEAIAAIAQSVGLAAVQLHGDESPEDCARLSLKVIKRFNILENETPEMLRARMERYRVSAYLLDPGAGSGRTFDWSLARGLPGPLIVSGGLTPANVGEAIRMLSPYAVDVSSGVECEPGRKDAEKVKAFIRAVRMADAERSDT
ncbi:MAG: phosphoribosylanthranilate isomerase, partial [Planctomycetes bacterium]|nr:phosphoribosylanthranilate isomerase [Planctomycetota bacterium]